MTEYNAIETTAKVIDVRDQTPHSTPAAISMDNFNAFIEQRKKWHTKTDTPNTYARTLGAVFDWFLSHGIIHPTADDFDNFREWLSTANASRPGYEAHPLSDYTRQARFNMARMFFQYLAKRGLYQDITIDTPRIEIASPGGKSAFTPAQVQDIMAQIPADNLRDKAIMLLMFNRGLRCVEVCRARVGDFTEQDGRFLLVIRGKGSRIDERAVPSDTAKTVKAYLASRGPLTPFAPLFASAANRNRGGDLTTFTISRMAAGYMKAAGWKASTGRDIRHTAHSARHTFITRMAEEMKKHPQHIDPFIIQEEARHSKSDTTRGYIHRATMTNSRAAEIVEAANLGRQCQENSVS